VTPAEQWHQWQREDRPTVGSRKPLDEYLVSNARYYAEQAFLDEAHAEPAQDWTVELWATVGDLLALARERGVTLCNIAEIGRR
jgi:hypothetical protein